MKKSIFKIICLILSLCMAFSAFVGCSGKKNETAASSESSSSSPDSSDEGTEEFEKESSEEDLSEDESEDEYYEDDYYEDDYYEEDYYEDDYYDDYYYEDNSSGDGFNEENSSQNGSFEDNSSDEWLDELPYEEEDDIYYEELTIKNSASSPSYFRGINFIHQMASYYTDSFGRLYTDKQRQYELELMENMGVKMIRAFYGSSLTYNPQTGEQDFNSQGMKEFISALKAMDSIDIEVGVTAIWQMKDLVDNKESNVTSRFSLGAPGIVVKDDWNATLKNYRNFIKNTVLTLKANGVNNMGYFFAYTECNNTFNDGLNIKGEKAENFRDDREYEKLYPLYDDLITALDGGLKDAGLRNSYKIVGPCDNWRADDGSEPESLLVKYTVENLADKVDIIGSHNGYDRANEYVNDMYYEIPPENLTYPMEQAKKIGKEYWVDEYNVAATRYGYEAVRLANKNPWKGVALGAMVNSVMNMGDVSNMFLWTLWDEQWPDNTESDVDGEFDNGVQICGYLNCLFETQTPLYPWYALSLLTRYVGEGNVYPCEGPGYVVYASAIKRNDGETTVVVTNYDVMEANVKINFEKSMGGKNFYRYIYDANTIKPVSGYEMIAADAVAKNVTTGFYDEIPSGSVVIYTTEKPDFVK